MILRCQNCGHEQYVDLDTEELTENPRCSECGGEMKCTHQSCTGCACDDCGKDFS